MTRTLTLVSVVVALLVLARPAPAGSTVAPGQAAPALTLPSGDGLSISLASMKGKVVLVDFWASWCGPCAAEFPALESLFQDYRTRGFDVLAVNLDEKRADADRFLADRPHAMTVAFDPGGVSAKAFGLEAMPTSFLIDREGRVRFVHTGFSTATIDSYRREIDQLLDEGR